MEEDLTEIPKLTQMELDQLAQSLEICYAVLDNLTDGHATYQASLTLRNKGDTPLKYANWIIYFNHIRMIESGSVSSKNGILLPGGLHLQHINGWLFQLRPIAAFLPLKKGDSLNIPFRGQYYSVARTDILPNWYIAAPGLTPKVIACTAGESLDFVAPFDAPCKWKRFDYVTESKKHRFDFYNPFLPHLRFEKNLVRDLHKPGKVIIPTPLKMTIHDSFQPLEFDSRKWNVCSDSLFKREAEYLADRLGASRLSDTTTNTPNTIILSQAEVSVSLDGRPQSTESYQLTVNTVMQQVYITSRDSSGIFCGIQTLLSLTSDGHLPVVDILDTPRFEYRGMHIDVARNFHGKETILRLLEAMAWYKFNVLHLHLSDDEGWRLQIPGLEELTEISSKRSHDIKEHLTLLPLLGSGPAVSLPGSGFFTIDEYREILRFAADRHIEVIPEIDMPGHCHAAVRAMQARYVRLRAAGDTEAAEQYRLSDKSDLSPDTKSVQMFSENTLNPALQSTYDFIRKVMQEIKEMHKDISPLRIFHFGGDEVPYRAWENSSACLELVKSGKVRSLKDLMQYFVTKVSEIAMELNLSIGAWQDGIVQKSSPPFPRATFQNKEIVVYAWKNLWETGTAADVYKLANSGYKVVLASGTHLYFDHPQEPDPEERGLYWASRFTDTHRVFNFTPENLLSSADLRLTGEPFTEEDLEALIKADDFELLQRPENIIGVQGQLWTELIRTSEQFDSMIYPRLLALAERSWHRADWEKLDRNDKQCKQAQDEDWVQFSNALGYKELSRLSTLGIVYYLPPPGGRITDKNMLEMNCHIPGLPLQFSLDDGQEWKPYSQPVDVSNCSHILLRTCSTDWKHFSRLIKISVNDGNGTDKLVSNLC